MDIQNQIEKHDKTQFLDWLRQFPDQVQNSWEIGSRVSIPDQELNSVLVCGMGGSGISGDLLAQYLFHTASVPVVSNRFYHIPEWVDENTLVILVSYSGNTEETLASYAEADEAGATCVAVTSNGTLEKKARDRDYTVINVPPDLPPRCAAGYLFIPLIFVLSELGLAPEPSEDAYREACDALLNLTEEFSPKSEDNRALELAERLHGKFIVVYGSEDVTAVLAQRFKNQLNENSKLFASYNILPELHHNEIMGWENLEDKSEKTAVIFLRDKDEHSKVQKRFELTRELMGESVDRIEEIQSRGDSLFCRFLTLMLYTDYVSYYLAILRGKDPVSIGPIEQLKEQL